jgi:nitrogen fixation NifU-like protein
MTERVRGRTVAEVDALCRQVHALVTAVPAAPIDDLGLLSALAGVRQFPMRVKCAMLAWEALRAAVHESDAVVSTE